jgi:3-oxoacyl-[acyl-carrier-protein] synthase II
MSSRLAALLRDNPIVVTGMGAFSAGGETVDKLWDAALRGRGTARMVSFQNGDRVESYPASVAPEIDFSREELRRLRRLDRCVQMAWVAADEAIAQSGLRGAYEPERVGVFVGTARGPAGKIYAAAAQSPEDKPLPSVVADNSFTSLSGALARSFGFHGPCITLAATCASAAVAIAQGAEQILLGRADAVLVGGTEAPLQWQGLRQFDAANVIATHEDPTQACRPFDADRNGLVLGEGSAFLILESLDSAQKRGAKVLARLTGWAYGCDVSSRTATAGEGVVRVVQQALRTAQINPEVIDYVNLHGTGTLLGDVAEAEAMRRVFTGETADVLCSSTKPITGHCLGATPALEAVLSIAALRQQTIPPSANCPNQDPSCRINLQTNSASPPHLRTAMSNSLGFWGQYASLIFADAE